MTRRAAILGLLLVSLLTGCSSIRAQGVFAYVDDQGRTAVYDLASRRLIWRSDHAGPEAMGPAWSPKGDLLGFAYRDPSDGHAYLGYVELGGMTVGKVDLNEPAETFFSSAVELSWSPSGSLLMLRTSGYPYSEVLIADIHKGSIISRFVTSGNVLWSPDGHRICYPILRGTAASPDTYHYDLISVDLSSGQSDTVFSGEPGYVISLLRWTDNVIFGYGSQRGGGYVVRDVSGTQYTQNPSAFFAAQPPAAVTAGLGEVGSACQNSTGAWLLTVFQSGSSWVYYSPNDSTKAVKVVRGHAPSWRPMPD